MLWFPQMDGDFACDIQFPKPNRNLQQSHQRRLDWNKFAAHKIEGDREGPGSLPASLVSSGPSEGAPRTTERAEGRIRVRSFL